MTRLSSLWEEEPDDPMRSRAADKRLYPLLQSLGVSTASPPQDLGGTMSLNLHLVEAGAVLRVHQPFESRDRLVALRRLRRELSIAGLNVAEPLLINGRDVVRWEGRWAELERFIAHSKPPPTWDSYQWMFAAMGKLHRALRALRHVEIPRPTLATFGPPGTLRRWMRTTSSAVRHDTRARELSANCEQLLRLLDRQWVPASRLPVQTIHGDVRLGSVACAADAEPVYLDFGFAAVRPRIHDFGYSLSWVILRPDASGTADQFRWDQLDELIGAYEDGSESPLTEVERACVGPYVASVPLYLAAISGFTADPVAHLVGNAAFVRIAEWILDHEPTVGRAATSGRPGSALREPLA